MVTDTTEAWKAGYAEAARVDFARARALAADLAIHGRIVQTVTALVEQAEHNGALSVDVRKLRRALDVDLVRAALGL